MPSSLTIDLILELYNKISDTVLALGATPEELKHALKLLVKGSARPRPSHAVLQNDIGLSQVLALWRMNARYVNKDGTPKVLPIRGRAPSLAHLAKESGLKLPVDQALELLCAQTEVIQLQGNKVALVGTPAAIVLGKTAKALAWLTTQMRALADTNVYNSYLPMEQRSKARFERQIYGMMTQAQFEAWCQAIRPALQEFANAIENGLSGQEGASDEQKMSGIGLFVFRESDETD